MAIIFSETIKNTITTAFDERFTHLEKPTGFDAVYQAADDHERLCLQYIYAFMPVSDMATYDAALFSQIARPALFVKEQNRFNEEIPDAVWFNFVLQSRINNENIEFNRAHFYEVLSGRVQGKTSEEAALAVNYWCLEKATYIGTNSRTVSPFTLMKNTLGRCGEESVFTVAALRSLGIPARQIYTPRWGHCDSNHAWVEAYVGGRWRFLGACEPEPVLDEGWFTQPASRGLLIYAHVFSTIPTDEEVAYVSAITLELNLTARYAFQTARLYVRVLNGNKEVRVHLQVVNSCELFSIVALTPDANGVVSLTVGRGDFYLHVTDGNGFITRKIDTRVETDVTVDFTQAAAVEDGEKRFVFVPPASDYKKPDYGLTESDWDAHKAKEAACHQIRKAYTATFADEAESKKLAGQYGVTFFDTEKFFVGAKGNLDAIKTFFNTPVTADGTLIPAKYKALLLRSLPEKDLTDCNPDILRDHLIGAYPYRDDYYEDIFMAYVLCPRVDIEMMSAYRSFINGFFDDETKRRFRANPRDVWRYIEENITDETRHDYKTDNDHRSLSASPSGLLAFKCGGDHSRRVLFVAICRSLGIAARFNPQTEALEFYNGAFVKVLDEVPAVKHQLTVRVTGGETLSYYENFTMARLDKGIYRTLTFHDGEPGSVFEVEKGKYRLLAGKRLPNGAMMINAYYVDIEGDVTVDITMPAMNHTAEAKSIGDFDFGLSLLSQYITGRSLVAYIQPSNEPTEHLLIELLDAKEDITHKNVTVLLVTQTVNETLESVKSALGGVEILQMADDAFARHLEDKLGLDGYNPPLLAFVDENGDVLYCAGGYHVGSVALALDLG